MAYLTINTKPQMISRFLLFFSLFLISLFAEEQKDLTTSKQVPKGMVLIPESKYKRGNDTDLGTRSKYPEESPVHITKVSSFYLDVTEVTNTQFLKFVEATGYVTQAEKGLSKKEFPNAPADQLLAGATVFSPPAEQPELWEAGAVYQWWTFTPGANWRHPLGPESKMKMDHPVVCVTNEDARAYAKWADKRLPTEAEWEAAARGGMEEKFFTWGNKPQPEGKWMANTYQGTFPTVDSGKDGFKTTAPVKSFPPNAYGLYDMAGNVWEHCSNYYRPDAYKQFSSAVADNPKGPNSPIDHQMLQYIERSIRLPKEAKPAHPLSFLYSSKGGSFLCHHTYCLRYRPAARHYSEGFSPTNHTGFRCAKDL